MADPLFQLLVPYFENGPSSRPIPTVHDPTTVKYLSRLTTLQLESLDTTEPQSLAQAAHSNILSIQALSTRSSKTVIASADHSRNLQIGLPELKKDSDQLQEFISILDQEAVGFAEKYSRSGENKVLDRRKKALLMSRNVDRLYDILDLPTLLSSAINSSATQTASNSTNYASALDLYSHIKRLHLLYPDSDLVQAIFGQAEDAMQEMTSSLIGSLRGQGVKLAAGIRTVGWLRRIAPELDGRRKNNSPGTGEGSLGALFLVCRLANLVSMLEALEPLRELADQETEKRQSEKDQVTNGNAWSGGQQTERYLKRYIEIFREQSFAIISLFKSIFPTTETANSDDLGIQSKSLRFMNTAPEHVTRKEDQLQPVPSALATFPMHLVELLTETLRRYMPNVRDKISRESLLTQVLYCAGSLGRLGGDFGLVLASLHNENDEDDDNDAEWVAVMKKHRDLAGRLELLAGSVGGHGKGAAASNIAASKLRGAKVVERSIQS